MAFRTATNDTAQTPRPATNRRDLQKSAHSEGHVHHTMAMHACASAASQRKRQFR
jgi:hypothetical protein